MLCLSFTACTSEVEKREQQLSNDTIMETVLPMIETHYDGILEEDYDKCFGVYAQFYQSAVADEWYYYNYSSNEEYIKGSADSLKETFGDDVEISVDVTDTKRLTLKQISDYKKLIKEIFALGTPHITDALEVTADVTYKGSVSEDCQETVWEAFLINDKWFLYDSYYEDVHEQFKEEQKTNDNKDSGAETNVVVVN